MKILMVTDVFPNSVQPNFGTFSLERLKSLKKRAEVKVFAPVPYFPSMPFLKFFKRWYGYTKIKENERALETDVFHPRRIVIPKIGGFTNGLFYRRMTQRKLEEISKSFRFDVIDAHFVWPDGYAAVHAGHKIGVPVCVTAHGTDLNLMPRFPWIKPFIIDTLKKADRVISVSQALADIALDLGSPPERTKVINNGVDISKFKRINKAEARNQLDISEDADLLISIGALIPRKAHHYLIEAMKIMVHSDGLKNLQLIIVGEGKSRSALEELIRKYDLTEHVRLAGSVPHDELYKWLSAADIFCLTSMREGWPTVFFEAWACGIPVIATAVHGAPEAICSDRYGMLIKKHDGEETARIIKSALNKEWNADELIEYASKNTWDKMVDKMFVELESIIEEYRRK